MFGAGSYIDITFNMNSKNKYLHLFKDKVHTSLTESVNECIYMFESVQTMLNDRIVIKEMKEISVSYKFIITNVSFIRLSEHFRKQDIFKVKDKPPNSV